MFRYQIRLALLSMKKTPGLSFLIALGIAIGIAGAMTAMTSYHNHGANPLAHKDDLIYSVRLNSWGPDSPYMTPNEPPWQLTHRDATALLRSELPKRRTVTYKTRMYIHPPDENQKPYSEIIRITHGDFFPMFDVPFLFGSHWDRQADEQGDAVVVINRETNDRVFGGINSVGRSLRLNEREYRVVGVTDHWNPAPKVYDLNNGAFQDAERVFLPFRFLEILELQSAGNTNGWIDGEPGFAGLLASEYVWLQMWVELPDGPAAFQNYIDSYTAEQKALGRFPREPNNRLDTPSTLLDERGVVDDRARTMLIIGFLVLLACVLNVVGLILGKFMARAPQVGVRRALGASRLQVFYQHLVESGVIGLLGAALALPLTLLSLEAIKRVYRGSDALFTLDTTMFLTLIGVSVLAAIAGGLFPAWSVCRTSPALYLKIQ